MNRHVILLAAISLVCCSIARVAVVAADVRGESDSKGPQNCAALLNLHWPLVRIASAELGSTLAGAGEIRGGGNAIRNPIDIRASHCRVSGVIGKETNFVLLLPDNWNHKFFMGGGGGYVGEIWNQAASTVTLGYATAGTDTGHKAGVRDAKWALDNLERQLNFGYLAIHETAEVSKAIIRAYYGTVPTYSYFWGVSRGGGQAMHEAVRYPDDFDGIVAGDPAMNWTGFAASFLRNAKAVFPDPSQTARPVITPENQKLLGSKILEVCDALDGVKDGVMEDPRMCKFDLATIPACKQDQPGADCFTTAQRSAIKQVYSPLANKNGPIFPGQPFGGEDDPNGWGIWITGTNGKPSAQWDFSTEFFKYFVFGDPSWDYTKYDFSNWNKDTRFLSSYMDATSSDLKQLKAMNHKLIIYNGWSDQAQTPLQAIQYFEQVQSRDPDARAYIRLFLLPGVTHPTIHGDAGPGPGTADWITVISDWVEHGKPPERVVASKLDDEGKVVRTRPLCVYPERADYLGTGDTNKENNFTCRQP
jgi:hypothetical protein